MWLEWKRNDSLNELSVFRPRFCLGWQTWLCSATGSHLVRFIKDLLSVCWVLRTVLFAAEPKGREAGFVALKGPDSFGGKAPTPRPRAGLNLGLLLPAASCEPRLRSALSPPVSVPAHVPRTHFSWPSHLDLSRHRFRTTRHPNKTPVSPTPLPNLGRFGDVWICLRMKKCSNSQMDLESSLWELVLPY